MGDLGGPLVYVYAHHERALGALNIYTENRTRTFVATDGHPTEEIQYTLSDACSMHLLFRCRFDVFDKK